MPCKSLISLIAACALLAVAASPGIAAAKKKSGDDLTALTACNDSAGAFPSAETGDEPGKGKPSPGQIGGKPSPGQIGNQTDDDPCVLGALPENEID